MCNQNFDFSINWLHGIKDYAIDHALSPTVHDTALLLNIKQKENEFNATKQSPTILSIDANLWLIFWRCTILKSKPKWLFDQELSEIESLEIVT